MAKEFKFDRFSKGKNLNINISELALKNENSKNLENDSQILENKIEVISTTQDNIALVSVQKQTAARTESVRGEAQSAALPDRPENSELAILERPLNNGVQTEYKQSANGVQNQVQTEYKQGTERSTESKQTEYKQGTNGVQNWTYFQIKGNEKKLLDFVFIKCDQIASRISPPLSPEVLASVYGEPNLKNKNTAKVCLRRLVTDKKMLKRLGSVCGRGGYTQVELSEHLFLTIKQNLSEYNRSTNGVQTDNKQGTQQGTQQGTNDSYSSSNSSKDLIKDITIEIPESLQRVVTKQKIIKMIELGQTDLEKVEFSLKNFAYDIEKGKRFKSGKDPIAILFGVLKNGDVYNSGKRVDEENEMLRIEQEDLKKKLDELTVRRNEKFRTEFKIFVAENPDTYIEKLGAQFLKGSGFESNENRFFELWKTKKEANEL